MKLLAPLLLALAVLGAAAQAQTGNPITVKNLKVTGPGSTGPVDGMSVLGRPLSTRAQDEINAFDNGVVCDGVTDNAAAFATIKSKLAPGKTVFFPPAAQPCMTTKRLDIVVSNVVIRANPGTVTLKQAAGNTDSVVLLNVGDASNVLVDGLSFDGGGSTLGTKRNAIQVFKGNNVVFDRINVANTRSIGVLFSQSKQSGVRRSTFTNIGNYWRTTLNKDDRQQGVAFCCTESGKTKADYPGNFVTDSVFTDIGLDAISMGASVNIVVSGNRCEMANPTQIAQITSSAYSACIYTADIDGATISGNYSYGTTGNAIDVSSTTGYTITGNYIMESSQTGIGAFGNYGNISGNTVLNSARWDRSPYKGGISIGSVPGTPSIGVTITGNLIADTSGTPIQPFGIHSYNNSCVSCLISNNQIGPMATSAYGGFINGPTPLPIAPEATIASASTTNIGAADSNQVAITGSATIVGFDAVANRVRRLRFTGSATLTHNTTTLILPGGANIVTRAGDTAVAVSDANGNWRVYDYQRADGSPSVLDLVQVDVITANGTWTKPAWAKMVTIHVVGGGGAGGSGRRGAAGTVRTAGGAGGAGGLAIETYPASELPATLAVEIGAGGAGGGAVTGNDTSGSPGEAGGQTVVRLAGNTILRAYGGLGGTGGGTASAPGGAAGNGFSFDSPNGGGAASSNTGAAGLGGGNGARAASGGGSGGGISSANAPSGGGQAGFAYLIGGNRGTGPAAAAAAGATGNAGLPKAWDRGFGSGGGGGGSGDAAGTQPGGAGGIGGAPGGGGGSGGASTNGANSGAGGAGGRGEVWIITKG